MEKKKTLRAKPKAAPAQALMFYARWDASGRPLTPNIVAAPISLILGLELRVRALESRLGL